LPHYYLAQIYDAQGKYQEAFNEWNDCFQLPQENEPTIWAWHKQADKRLTELEQILSKK